MTSNKKKSYKRKTKYPSFYNFIIRSCESYYNLPLFGSIHNLSPFGKLKKIKILPFGIFAKFSKHVLDVF